MLFTTALIASAFSALAAAQSTGSSGAVWDARNISLTSSQIQAINTTDRLAWCRGERNTCPLICGGQTSANTCDENTLVFNCTCSGGNTPNISDFQQTLPFFVCQEWVKECTADFPNNLASQTYCQSVICGSKNATGSSTAGSTSRGGASATGGTPSSTGSPSGSGSPAAATSSRAAAAALRVAKDYSTGALALGLFGLFGLVL